MAYALPGCFFICHEHLQDILDAAALDHAKLTKTYLRMWRDNLNPDKATAPCQPTHALVRVEGGGGMEGLKAVEA